MVTLVRRPSLTASSSPRASFSQTVLIPEPVRRAAAATDTAKGLSCGCLLSSIMGRLRPDYSEGVYPGADLAKKVREIPRNYLFYPFKRLIELFGQCLFDRSERCGATSLLTP